MLGAGRGEVLQQRAPRNRVHANVVNRDQQPIPAVAGEQHGTNQPPARHRQSRVDITSGQPAHRVPIIHRDVRQINDPQNLAVGRRHNVGNPTIVHMGQSRAQCVVMRDKCG
jgi:hypothetical protein